MPACMHAVVLDPGFLLSLAIICYHFNTLLKERRKNENRSSVEKWVPANVDALQPPLKENSYTQEMGGNSGARTNWNGVVA